MTTPGTSPLGLALEGGGAKGAYHMGVVKAYLERGYTFGAVAGTSIGALNGAVIAQGNFEAGYRMWEEMNPLSIFDFEESEYQQLLQLKLNRSTLRQITATTKKLIASRGMDTSKIRNLIHKLIDERRLRETPIDFGLVTVSVTDRLPLELYKEDIPLGRMIDYLIASAAFPGFQPAVIENKLFLDGGFYDNCPINMVARKGFKHIIAIRTFGLGFTRKVAYPDVSVTQIIPSENLGGILNFSNELIQRNLKMGYYDAKRQLEQLRGEKYYFLSDGLDEEQCTQMMKSIPDTTISSLGRMLSVGGAQRGKALTAQVVEQLTALTGLPIQAPLHKIMIRLAETLAAAKGIDKYQVYRFNDLCRSARVGPLKRTDGLGPKQVAICMAAQKIFNSIDL